MVHRSDSSWSGKRRLEFIEDSLSDPGYFQRQDVANYFACDPSLVSFDIREYERLGGKFEIRIGLWRDGVFTKAALKGGAGKFFFPTADHTPVLNSTPARIKAWDAIQTTATDNNAWFDEIMCKWADDHPDAGVEDLAGYFGVSEAVAGSVLGTERDAVDEVRAKVWEVWG